MVSNIKYIKFDNQVVTFATPKQGQMISNQNLFFMVGARKKKKKEGRRLKMNKYGIRDGQLQQKDTWTGAQASYDIRPPARLNDDYVC